MSSNNWWAQTFFGHPQAKVASIASIAYISMLLLMGADAVAILSAIATALVYVYSIHCMTSGKCTRWAWFVTGYLIASYAFDASLSAYALRASVPMRRRYEIVVAATQA
jgi:uncharacterized membrane protein